PNRSPIGQPASTVSTVVDVDAAVLVRRVRRRLGRSASPSPSADSSASTVGVVSSDAPEVASSVLREVLAFPSEASAPAVSVAEGSACSACSACSALFAASSLAVLRLVDFLVLPLACSEAAVSSALPLSDCLPAFSALSFFLRPPLPFLPSIGSSDNNSPRPPQCSHVCENASRSP